MSDSSGGATSLGGISVDGDSRDTRSGGTGGDHRNGGHHHGSDAPAPAGPPGQPVDVLGQYPDAGEMKTNIKNDEGTRSYPYMDSAEDKNGKPKGNVTAGIGHKIDTKKEFDRLPWIVTATGKPATKKQKEAAWDALKAFNATHANYKADAYANVTGLELSNDEINSLFNQDLSNAEESAKHFSKHEWGSMPTPAKEALIDMTYNVGAGELEKGFPNFTKAIRSGNYAEAAAQSHIKGISDQRNQFNHDKLMEAAQKK